MAQAAQRAMPSFELASRFPSVGINGLLKCFWIFLSEVFFNVEIGGFSITLRTRLGARSWCHPSRQPIDVRLPGDVRHQPTQYFYLTFIFATRNCKTCKTFICCLAILWLFSGKPLEQTSQSPMFLSILGSRTHTNPSVYCICAWHVARYPDSFCFRWTGELVNLKPLAVLDCVRDGYDKVLWFHWSVSNWLTPFGTLEPIARPGAVFDHAPRPSHAPLPARWLRGLSCSQAGPPKGYSSSSLGPSCCPLWCAPVWRHWTWHLAQMLSKPEGNPQTTSKQFCRVWGPSNTFLLGH